MGGMRIELPGRQPIVLEELVLDFTGTLSKDGELIAGVDQRLTDLSRRIHVTVLTADTFGTARAVLAGLPLQVTIVRTGKDKADYVNDRGPDRVVAIGNGRNDGPMCGAAALSIAIVGPEGAASELIREADVVVGDIRDGLDLLQNPMRLTATLRD